MVKPALKFSKIVRLTSNNQVAIPAAIVRRLSLHKGSYLEVEERGRQIIMTPKQLVDDEDAAMYREVIKRGREQLAHGETVTWDEVKQKLNRQSS